MAKDRFLEYSILRIVCAVSSGDRGRGNYWIALSFKDLRQISRNRSCFCRQKKSAHRTVDSFTFARRKQKNNTKSANALDNGLHFFVLLLTACVSSTKKSFVTSFSLYTTRLMPMSFSRILNRVLTYVFALSVSIKAIKKTSVSYFFLMITIRTPL